MMTTSRLTNILLPLTMVAMGALLLANSANAAVVSTSTTAPATDAFDQYNLGTPTGTQKWFDDIEHDAGQTFTPAVNVNLHAWTIQLNGSNPNDAGNEWVNIRLGTVTRPAGAFTFTDIYSEAAFMGASPGGDWLSGDYITFTFDAAQALTGGVEYGIIHDAQSMGVWQLGIPYIEKTGNAYAGGVQINRGSENTGSDTVFHADFSEGAPPPLLSLSVNTLTGAITMLGDEDEPISFSYYEIISAGNSLSTAGWTSLADQNLDGWDEAGGSGPDVLAEAYLLGNSEIAAGYHGIFLGSAYDTAIDAQDLTFRYLTDEGQVFDGTVEYGHYVYVNPDDGQPADLNPEPSSLALMVIGLVGFCFRGRRRRVTRG